MTQRRRCPSSRTASTSSFSTPGRTTTKLLFGLARTKLDPGGIVVADNVTTSSTVEAYAAARQADPTLVSVTVPIGHGLEVTTVLQP